MIHLRLSKRLIRSVGITLAVIAFLVACYLIGDALTPRDAQGDPLIFSPTVRNTEMYQRAAIRWAQEMSAVDDGLVALLAQDNLTDPAQLYAAGDKAQRLVDRAAAVVRGAEFTAAPPALVGLSEQSKATANAYLQAALATTRWIGAPTPEDRRATNELLLQARAARQTLETSRWLEPARKGADE